MFRYGRPGFAGGLFYKVFYMIKLLTDNIGLEYEKLEEETFRFRLDKVYPGRVRVGEECTLYFKNELTSSITVSLARKGGHDQRSAWLYAEEGLYAIHFNTRGYQPGRYELWLKGVGVPDWLMMSFRVLKPVDV